MERQRVERFGKQRGKVGMILVYGDSSSPRSRSPQRARSIFTRKKPHSEGQLKVLALDPEQVWLTHVDEPWRPDQKKDK